MKRGGNLKRTPLARRTPLRNTPLERSSAPLKPSKPLGGGLARKGKARPLEPGEAAWKRKRYGRCAACNRYGRIVLHHVVRESDIRAMASPQAVAEGICWRMENALGLGAPYAMGGNPDCQCHAQHHMRGISDRRLPLSLIPASARTFAVELMGHEAAWAYLEAHYR